MLSTRALAAQNLQKLLDNNGSLSTLLEPHKSREDFQLLQELSYGSCRWFHRLSFYLEELLGKPLKKKDGDVFALLILGLYQLREMRVPDHAVLNETVTATVQLGKPWAKALVNGVLRNYLRQQAQLDARLQQQDLARQHSHPQWLADRLREAWPADYAAILGANNQRPPMTLRVNSARVSRDDYLQQLADAEIGARPGPLAPSCIYLESPVNVTALPGFEAGLVSVQDEASQLIPPLLELAAGQRVLDACAAPGGKTCHLLESEHSLTELIALDRSSQRLLRLKENLARLQLQARVVAADAGDLGHWWDSQPFDRVLLDAPCSGSGVIRRHPDIKLLRQPADIDKLRQQQRQLLTKLWRVLKPGGLLLYTSCSILPAENDLLVAEFLAETSDAKYEGIAADWGVECSNGRQLLPKAENGPDGFFYSLLRKQ